MTLAPEIKDTSPEKLLAPVLSAFWDEDRSWTLDVYRRHEGYEGLRKALAMSPDDLIAYVKDSGLRGRGGAGFPTGMKWQFIPQGDGKPHYLVVNADESEPGTCKDIPLLFANPHSLIEGIVIACYAIRSSHAFIYLRGEVVPVLRRLHEAVREAYEAGYLGENILGSGLDLQLTVHAGAGAYICGEETALLDSLEGRRGQPRLRPPFPAVAGLYACPTVVNNVESIASVPAILQKGKEWFRSMGSEKSPGFTLYSLSGHVASPGQYEAPLGITLRQLLQMSGGMRPGHRLKFWTPGGSSTPMFTEEHLDVPLDYEGVGAAGSMLGTKALQCFDETTCVVRAVTRWTEFYAHESCGKCTPCREGTYWLVQLLRDIEGRQGRHVRPRQAERHRRQHQRQVLLRPRRRRRLADLLLAQVLPRGVRAAHHGPWLPLRPGQVDGLGRPPHGGERMTVTTNAPSGGGEAAVPPEDLVSLTIDGVEISVPKGTLVIRAAEQLGIEIPRFCDHPLLDPAGACRQCIVEVEGQRKPMASCTITCTDGMVVKTHLTSPVAEKAQHGVMELLLINHPLDCPVCDKGGECPLQNQAMSHGQAESRFEERSGPTRSPCRSPRRCCSTVSGACCAPAAPGSPTRSRATR